MSKLIKVLIVLGIVAVILAAGGKYGVMALLAALTPVYTILLYSVILAIFIATAVVAVAISRSMPKHKGEEQTGVKDGDAHKEKAA